MSGRFGPDCSRRACFCRCGEHLKECLWDPWTGVGGEPGGPVLLGPHCCSGTDEGKVQPFAYLISVLMLWPASPAVQSRYTGPGGNTRRPMKGDHGGAGEERSCHSVRKAEKYILRRQFSFVAVWFCSIY